MQNSGYNSYDELPLFLHAEPVAKVLGVGRGIVVSKKQFIQWEIARTEG